ncbi:S41 family peptidase [Suipraeoptans intestinalis]|uniref:S41 family peptidase n=1 Tax=Suipraeoptans intestinalis TaxID=2606628 RepID=A0A6N7USY9_9FIRM|nr:S41 family peptidase [Suipraeoptans intestinalis]MDD7769823.1 S41 family peptidase [Suipraeoptans intestinalis]MSR94311.1 S41 family peptidase [Suipraeoptans intestinalis]
MKNKKSFLAGALCGALAVLLIVGCIGVGRRLAGLAGNASMEGKVKAIRSMIQEVYIGEVDEKTLQESMLKGYVAGLGDPYSSYFTKEETKEFNEMTSGEFSGVGAILNMNKDTQEVELVKIYKGYPADKAGLKAGDVVIKVDDTDVTGMTLQEVVSMIKGEKGTEVKITVTRGEGEEELTVTAVRDTVQVQTVDYRMLENQIGYIQVTEFDAVTAEQYQKAMDDLTQQGMTGLVVDLRGNPGGSLDTVCQMLDTMLPEGLIVYMEDKSGARTEETSDAEHQFTKPLAVLVDGNSASASEIFAGAIQDYGIGKIVGTQTYGKGVVQQIFELKDGSSVKLTIAEYFTPKGRNINGKGITPDVKLEAPASGSGTGSQTDPGEDAWVAEAVKAISAQ